MGKHRDLFLKKQNFFERLKYYFPDHSFSAESQEDVDIVWAFGPVEANAFTSPKSSNLMDRYSVGFFLKIRKGLNANQCAKARKLSKASTKKLS